MTERLYYDAPDLLSFDTVVTNVMQTQEGLRVWLRQSAFYPTSGGQPHDTGVVGDCPVRDVLVENGDVVHIVDGSADALQVGMSVHCSVDARRRRDHMQQHCGEHMLAYLVWKHFGGYTHGLHIGEEASSIDVTMPGGEVHLDALSMREIEEEWNDWIQQDQPIRSWFPSEQELAALPLRKDAGEHEHTRIVHIAPHEYIACGGTHPARTGEVGCGQILSTKPARGKMRITFVCGLRAVREARRKADACLQAATDLSTGWEELPEAVNRLVDKCSEQTARMHALQVDSLYAQLQAASQRDSLQAADGTPLVSVDLGDVEYGPARDAACRFVRDSRAYLLVSAQGKLCFVRSEGCGCSMGALLSATAKKLGGKGGGTPDFAQGAVPEGAAALRLAADSLLRGYV